jgi:hypothetical protein
MLSLKQRFRKTISKKRKKNMKKIGGGIFSGKAKNRDTEPQGVPVKGVPVKGALITEELPTGVPTGVPVIEGVKADGVPVKEGVKADGAPKTLEPDTCPVDIEELKNQLKTIEITSFEDKAAEAAATTTDMQKYDKAAKRTLLLENAVRLLHFAGCAIPLVSSVAEIGLVLLTGISNINHSKALTYLASKCLDYVAHISKNLAIMLAFYQTDIVKEKNIEKDEKLYGELQKNLYTFLYFLIDSINFKIADDVGPQHYLYWYTFILKVDFSKDSEYDKPIPTDKYRYSCIACIPSDTLRKKMRTKPDKKLVTLDIPSKRTMNNTDDLLGFCSADVLNICKNYNDNIMRLIELNMYTLIGSAHKYYFRIDILRYSEKNVSDKFFRAVFSNEKITEEKKNDFKSEFTNSLQNSKNRTGGAIRAFNPDLILTFNFLIELNRIIFELEYPIITDKKFGMSRALDSGKYYISPATNFFSDSKIQYEELLREYTLMTGNFLMLTSNFALDNNKLGVVDKERVLIKVNERLKPLASAIRIIDNVLTKVATQVGQFAETLFDYKTDADTGPGAGPGAGATSNESHEQSSAGGRNLSKKNYRFFQKCKTKRNRRKRRAF